MRPVPLNVIQIKNPCPADWNAMHGDDRSRFCGECRLHVYNLSAMSKSEAEDLIASKEGRLCVRYFQREDGTVITDDCSRIRKAIRRTKLMLSGAASALMMLMLSPFGYGSVKPILPSLPGSDVGMEVKGDIAPPREMPQELLGKLRAPEPAAMGEMVPLMGAIAPPSTQPATQPTTAPTTQASE